MIQLNNQLLDIDIESVISKLKEYFPDKFYKCIDTPQNYMICCPFHKDGHERRPSMGILKKDGTCHCFTCDWVGSLSEMISNLFGYDDFGRYGNKWLLSNFKSILVEERSDIDLDFTRDKKVNEVKYVSEEELDGYRYYHNYWTTRRITSEWLIELFDLGYDKSTDCITFPVRDINGNVLFVAKRNTKTKFFNYPSGVTKPLYGLYELFQLSEFPKEVIVCESMIDALTCWQYGKYAVALNGLGNDLQFKQLSELPARKLILATDMDTAGLRARARMKKYVKNKILTQYVWDVNIAKDINDMDKQMFDNLREIFL